MEEFIRNTCEIIADRLNSKNVLDAFYSNSIISKEEHEKINSLNTGSDRWELVKILRNK